MTGAAMRKQETFMLGNSAARIAVSGLVFFATLVPALAQQRPTQAQINAIRQSCRSDYQAHCSSVPTGGSAALACLQQNAESLSPACGRAVAAAGGGSAGGGSESAAPAAPAPMPQGGGAHAGSGGLRQACGMDFRTYCHGIRPGGGRAIACLKENAPSLSPGCQEALESLRGGR